MIGSRVADMVELGGGPGRLGEPLEWSPDRRGLGFVPLFVTDTGGGSSRILGA